MRKALVLMMTTCILFAGCIEGLVEDAESLPEEIIPGCNDSTALNYNENDTSATSCISTQMAFEAMEDFSTLLESEEPPANSGFTMTMTGVDEEMDMGEYTVVSTVAVNDNAVHSATSVTIASAGMTISEAWTMMEPANTGGSLIQVTYMGESFLMQSAMSMANASADEEEDGSSTDDESSGEIDMGLPDAADMTAMLGEFDDCIASNACEFPEGTTMDFPTLTSGMISMPVNNPEDGHSMEMTMQLGESGVIMTGFHMDMGDQSMGLELLSSDEVSALLTIDVSLESEALPFSLSEYWVQPGSDDDEGSEDVFVCDNGEEIPASWENDGEEDCDDGSDEEPSVHSWESYENGYCEWEGNLENHGEDRWSCEEDASLSDWDNWWWYCELHGEDWFCTDDYGQDSNHEYSANNSNYNESNASEEDPSSVDGMNWDGLYPRGYCEWEGNPDDVDEDRWSCKGVEWDDWWYYCENHDVDWHCTDDKGQSADYEHSANGTEWLEFEEPEVFVCDNGNEISMDWVNDGMDDCGDNSDEGVDDDNWDDSDDSSNTLWWIVGSDGQFDFAGYLAEYSIVLASCSEEDDSGTLNCGDDLMSVGLVDAMADGENAVLDPNNFTGIGFADEDDSGTLTDGDIIMVGGNTSVDWTHVRLHSSTAQAYSDENPTLPGFTTVLGVLSLMGAALINRRD